MDGVQGLGVSANTMGISVMQAWTCVVWHSTISLSHLLGRLSEVASYGSKCWSGITFEYWTLTRVVLESDHPIHGHH